MAAPSATRAGTGVWAEVPRLRRSCRHRRWGEAGGGWLHGGLRCGGDVASRLVGLGDDTSQLGEFG
ncbi:hypothetical protein A8M60_20870 [Nocardia farcinica]|nr:hypothetical protein A8M60_20870 [Nocardia farcinica]